MVEVVEWVKVEVELPSAPVSDAELEPTGRTETVEVGTTTTEMVLVTVFWVLMVVVITLGEARTVVDPAVVRV